MCVYAYIARVTISRLRKEHSVCLCLCEATSVEVHAGVIYIRVRLVRGEQYSVYTDVAGELERRGRG